jgi:DNA-binding MarR family transcriptional regulator
MDRREPTDEETREILDALRRILRYLRNAAATTHGSLGITAAQLFVVRTLADASTPLSVNELAERTYADQSTVSVVAKRLEGRGLLTRRRSSSDRRRVDLVMTPKGRALLRRSLESPQHGVLDGIRQISPAARSGLAKFLPELMRAMGLDRTPAAMMFEDDGRGARPRPRARRTP